MARAIDADAVKFSISGLRYIDPNDYFALAEYFMKQVKAMPTLTPPNEWVRRVKELDELYTKLQILTGFTAEQLLEMFAAGYTLEKPDYSKHFEAMANLAESDPPNEPLTWDEFEAMIDKPVYIIELERPKRSYWALVHQVSDAGVMLTSAVDLHDYGSRDLYGQSWLAYRRPPERQEDK